MRYSLSTNTRRKTLSDLPYVALVFTVCLLCWTAGYLYFVGFPIADSNVILPLWDDLCSLLSNRVIVYVLGLSLFLLSAFVIQRINDIEMLIRERTRIPFMLFILLVSSNAGLLPLKGVTFVLVCLVFVVYELFNSYQLPEATGKLFNAGVFIGVAGLFMPQALLFVPLLWIGMYQFRSLSYKSFMASLIGVLLIYWFVLAWCVWKHDFSILMSLYSSLANFDVFSFTLFRYHYIGFAGMLLLLIVAFFHIQVDVFNNSVRVRQMLSFLLNMSAWSLVLLFLYSDNADSFMAILYIPASVVIAYFLENIRPRFCFILFYFMLALLCASYIMRIWSF